MNETDDGRHYDAIIIGGGPGGIACAALLAKSGVRTLLLEKNSRTGGKAITIERAGFKYELGPKLQVPMRGPAFAPLFTELGIDAQFRPIPLDAAAMVYRGRSGAYKTKITDQRTGMDPTPFFELWELNERERGAAAQVLAEMVLMPEETLATLDDVTLHDWLQSRDVPAPLYNYLAMHANASLAEPIDLVAASEQIRILKQIAASGGGGYYVGGFGSLFEAVTASFVASGGELRTRQRVERIVVEDGRATGIATADGVFHAPMIISNAGIQPTVLKLVGEDRFEPSYSAYVRALVPGWGFTGVRYFLGQRAMKHCMYMVYADDTWWNVERFERARAGQIPDEVIMFMTVPSNFETTMAPPGKQCIIAGTICSPDPEAKEIAALWQKMDEMMAKLFPDAWAAVESIDREGPAEVSSMSRDHVLPGQGGECVGIGQIAGQCGALKPSPRSPVEGLYFVGGDAGSGGMGTHQATDSGMKVARMVLEDRAARQLAPA